MYAHLNIRTTTGTTRRRTDHRAIHRAALDVETRRRRPGLWPSVRTRPRLARRLSPELAPTAA